MISTECISLSNQVKLKNRKPNHKSVGDCLSVHSNTAKELVLKKIAIDQINQNIAFMKFLISIYFFFKSIKKNNYISFILFPIQVQEEKDSSLAMEIQIFIRM